MSKIGRTLILLVFALFSGIIITCLLVYISDAGLPPPTHVISSYETIQYLPDYEEILDQLPQSISSKYLRVGMGKGFGYQFWNLTFNSPYRLSDNINKLPKPVADAFISQFGWPFLCYSTTSPEVGMRKIYHRLIKAKPRKGPEGRIITVSSPGRILFAGAVANVLLFGVLFLVVLSLVGVGFSRRVMVPIAVGVCAPIVAGWGCYYINPLVMPSSKYHALHPYGQVSLAEAREVLPWVDLPADEADAKSLEITVERAFGLCEWSFSRSYLGNLDEDVSRDDPHARHLCTGVGLAFGWPVAGLVTHTEPDRIPALGWRPNRFDIVTKTPMRIYVPGYFFDVIFYTAIAFVLFLVPGMLRRFVRRRRGLCVVCGYPVGVSDRCSECGEVISGRES